MAFNVLRFFILLLRDVRIVIVQKTAASADQRRLHRCRQTGAEHQPSS